MGSSSFKVALGALLCTNAVLAFQQLKPSVSWRVKAVPVFSTVLDNENEAETEPIAPLGESGMPGNSSKDGSDVPHIVYPSSMSDLGKNQLRSQPPPDVDDLESQAKELALLNQEGKPDFSPQAISTILENNEPAKLDNAIFAFNKFIVETMYAFICFLYPVNGGERDYARFFVLETVARIPYFAYLSVLHVRETFGERNLEEQMRTHYAETDNETHHLLIMEALGGNSKTVDRAFASILGFFYFFYVVIIYSISEATAYHLSELIEDHAYNTYDGFLTANGEKLKTMPVPDIARKYYEEDNPYLFDLISTVNEGENLLTHRRPKLDSLYDVFVNIREDEKEHWKTLCNLVQYDDMHGNGSRLVSSTVARSKDDVHHV